MKTAFALICAVTLVSACASKNTLELTSNNRYKKYCTLGKLNITQCAKAQDEQVRLNEIERVKTERIAALRAEENAFNAPSAALPQEPYGSMIDGLLQADSRSWVYNKYRLNSVRDIRKIDLPNGDSKLKADFSYDGSGSGWLKVTERAGRAYCVEFHNFSGNCRGIGSSPSSGYAALAGVMALGVAASGSGGGGGSSNSEENFRRRMDNANRNNPNYTYQ